MVAVVDCPTCGKKVEWTEANKYRPFCSKRCADVDLSRWLKGSYAIPAVELDDPDDAAPEDEDQDIRR